ncbi:serine/threonine-protein kinase PAK 1 [Lates japonicus]|uniref:Serine/threonine-protein kinase PAK 1 n=1 Tax=Lates japonicus TaxID=270547 RepID=A0AAD3N541_LATJO|nr:serine/threonine-protein kinase PAK 1 [Lates japonicus]
MSDNGEVEDCPSAPPKEVNTSTMIGSCNKDPTPSTTAPSSLPPNPRTRRRKIADPSILTGGGDKSEHGEFNLIRWTCFPLPQPPPLSRGCPLYGWPV